MDHLNLEDILLEAWHNKRPNWAVLGLFLAGLAPLSWAAYSWISSVGYIIQALYGMATGFAMVALFHFYSLRRSKHRRRRAAFIAAMSNLSKKDLERLFPRGFHHALSFSDMGSEHWLNRNLRVVWPHLSQAASALVKNTLQGALNDYRIEFIKSVEVTTVSLGTVAPDLRGVRCGGHHPSIPGDDIVLEAELDWRRPRGELLELKVTPAVGPAIKIQVKKIQFHCMLKLVFKPLVDELPCIGAMLVSMSDEPTVNYKIELVGVPDVTSLPAFDKMIDDSIKSAIVDSLVWPARKIIPFMDRDFSYLALLPVGIVNIILIEARDIIQVDVISKSDPFVVMFIHKKQGLVKRSSSKKNTQKPYWNEGFDLEVEDPNFQAVNFVVMDSEVLGKADFLGAAVFPLTELKPFKQQDIWLELFADVKNPRKGRRGKLRVRMTYKPFKEQEPLSPLSDGDSVEVGSQTDGESLGGDLGSSGVSEELRASACRNNGVAEIESAVDSSRRRQGLLVPEGSPSLPPLMPQAKGGQPQQPLGSQNGVNLVRHHSATLPGQPTTHIEGGGGRAGDGKPHVIRRRMPSLPATPVGKDRFDLQPSWSGELEKARHRRSMASESLGAEVSFLGTTSPGKQQLERREEGWFSSREQDAYALGGSVLTSPVGSFRPPTNRRIPVPENGDGGTGHKPSPRSAYWSPSRLLS
ncbi:hypothetical protein CBR_g40378 [Chara braunii]|uniref:C2 domain-containing protein n=1 Tax=Chara braunii TaxID=69332 RepID=A0A388LTR3_CHABU|nr:hypothetical protein CBR_g40378 [Chara braunii]|eukprot:GBG85649.1 hypothetical protein CBR_g40378 [Chara braunii]